MQISWFIPVTVFSLSYKTIGFCPLRSSILLSPIFQKSREQALPTPGIV
jgi:hypothetical protein